MKKNDVKRMVLGYGFIALLLAVPLTVSLALNGRVLSFRDIPLLLIAILSSKPLIALIGICVIWYGIKLMFSKIKNNTDKDIVKQN